MKQRSKSILVVSSLLIVLATGYFFKEYALNLFGSKALVQAKPIQESERVLIIAPHCDDEALSTSGLISNALKKGADIKVIFMTNGDGDTRSAEKLFATDNPTAENYIRLGYIRHEEATAAMNFLGISDKNLYFLGYPDEGLEKLWYPNWSSEDAYININTKKHYSPYDFSYTSHALYSGEQLMKDLTTIISQYEPTTLVFPHPNDDHKDHQATYAFVKYILNQLNIIKPEEMLYLTHYALWPAPFGDKQSLPLKPPKALVNHGTQWSELTLSKDEIKSKNTALQFYKSQIAVTKTYMQSFVRTNELFGSYPELSISALSKNAGKSLQVIFDNKSNIPEKIIKPSDDIKAVTLMYQEDEWSITLNLFGKLDTACTYGLDVTIFYEDGRIEKLYPKAAAEDNSKLKVQDMNSDTSKTIAISAQGSSITFMMPHSSIQSIRSILLRGRTLRNGKEKDSTAWRLVHFVSP